MVNLRIKLLKLSPYQLKMALPTDIDRRAAMMYAIDRLKKEECNLQNPTDFKYESEEKNRMYRCPVGLEDCEHGNCKVASKQKCNDLSQMPYDPTTGGDLSSQKCDDTHPCPADSKCGTSGKCIPAKPYLEYRNDKCVYGNFALKKWCEFPNQRRLTPTKGVTDVPPFQYNPDTGSCNITREYCDWMGQSYKLDDRNRPTCYSTTGQNVGEFFVGKTIFRDLKPRTTVAPNFAGNKISLYMNDQTLAFNLNEIAREYPELVRENVVKFSPEDLKHSGKKRLYFTLKHSSWLNPTIQKLTKPT